MPDEALERHGHDADWRNWRRSFLGVLDFPVAASVIGQPVVVLEVVYDGSPRRGLTARCRTHDDQEYQVALTDVRFRVNTKAARLCEQYQRWLAGDLEATPAERPAHGVPERALRIGDTSRVEMIILAVKERAARCRLLSSDHTVTLRATRLWDVVPGEIVTIQTRRLWRYARAQYIAGDIVGTRLDVSALGLMPLRLEPTGTWDPAEEYWGDEIEPWARDVIAGGPRPEFEMEQVLPTQRHAWLEEAAILQTALAPRTGSIYLEFTIPRMGRRIDAVVIIGSVIFVLEFKVGEDTFHTQDLDQVIDYALDLHNFHEGSHDAYMAPCLTAHQRQRTLREHRKCRSSFFPPLCC